MRAKQLHAPIRASNDLSSHKLKIRFFLPYCSHNSIKMLFLFLFIGMVIHDAHIYITRNNIKLAYLPEFFTNTDELHEFYTLS